MRHPVAFACVLALIMTASPNAQTAPLKFESAETQTALLELYTSEGCSSCPPAEEWLSQLKGSPRLWRDFVPLAFHVDYWDRLGWRDPWGANQFSERQQAYAALWRNDSIYTPGFVVNGKEWRNWARRAEAPGHSGTKVGVLTVTSSGTNHWHVSFAPLGGSAGKYVVHAARLAGGLSSNVKAGENSGRILKHDFIVLRLVEEPLTRSGSRVEGDFTLPPEHADEGGSRALATWVTEEGSLQPLQATGGWLVSSAAGH